MSIHEKQKSCKLFRRITAGILSAVMFTGSVMANYAGLIENSTMFAAGEEPTAISENSQKLVEIANGWDYTIELKPNGQWKLKLINNNYVDTIPANIMSASDFDDYKDNIDEIELPSYGIKKIAAHAFEGMKSLHTVSGGSAVNEIGEAAFKGCTYLTQFFAVTPTPSGSAYSQLKTIGNEAFSNTGLTEVSFLSTLETVGERAFYGCKDLTSISFSGNNSNEVIFGAESFADCTALKDIDLQKCTGSITFENGGSEQRSVFHNCTALEEVTVPASAKGNLNSLFRGATALKTITFADNSMITEVTHIVSGSPVEVLDLTPLKGLTEIGNWCFSGDKSITKVIIPSNVNSFGQQAMAEMSSLGTVEFAEGNTAKWLGNELFKNDTSLNSINLEVLSNLLSISESAFDGCTALTSITIPDKVTEIQANAFGRCVGLVDLKYNAANLTNVGNGIFDGAGVFDLTIGENVNEIPAKFLFQAQDHISGLSFVGTPTFTIKDDGYALNAPFEAGGKYTVDSNGNLYKIEGDGAKLVYANKTAETINIPATVGNNVAVTGVASNAFRNANVKTLNFDNIGNITTLDDYAFANATLLASINDADTVDAVKNLFTGITEKDSIQDNVFYKTAIGEGIQDDSKEEVFPPEGVEGAGKAIPEKHDTLIKVDRPNDVGTSVMSLNYIVQNHGEEIQESEDKERKGKFWTGETAKVGFSYVGGRPVRIYIKANDDGDIILNSNGTQPQKTSQDGIYYYDIVYKGSETGQDYLNLSYPNFSSPGSKMQVWAVEFDDATVYEEFKNNKEVIYPGSGDVDKKYKIPNQYFEIEWTTKPIDFTLEKNWVSNANLNFIKSSDDKITVSNLKWEIIFKKTNPEDEDKNLGSDIVRYVDYTDTLVLPNKLSWREEIGNNLDQTHFVKKGKDSTLYITIGEKEYELFTLTNVDNLVDMSIKKNEDGTYSLCWRVINPNTKAEISPIENGYITFGPEVIIANNINAGEKIEKITNNISAEEYFTFSEMQEDKNSAEATGCTAPESKLIFNKERMNDVSRMGEDVEYKITVENPSVFTYTDMHKITDNLNADKQRMHYIKPENMQRLFDDEENGDKLTITINDAVLANKLTGETKVKTINNSKDTIEIFEQNTANNTDSETAYKELGTENDAAHHNVTITLKKDGENIKLEYTGGNPAVTSGTITIGDEQTYKDIASALDSIGYIVTNSDSYQLEWDFGSNYPFEGGKTMEFTINASIKDSLMYLAEKDQNYYYGWPQVVSVNTFNTAKIDDSVEYSATTPQQNVTKDLEIRKRAYVGDRELNETYQPKDDDVIDYFVKAMHYGSGSYKVLPVVDHMTGRQVVIVDAEKNKNAEWAKNDITKIEIDGKEYYVLNKPGTYKGVYTSEYFYADSIEVKSIEGGLDTLIKYYIENTPEINFDVDVTYKAIVSKDLSGDKSTATEYTLSNEAWLNDRPGHRIYDTLGLSGSAVEFDKKILVGGMQDNPENEKLLTELPIKKLENEVTYRLMLHSTSPVIKNESGEITNIGGDLTLTGKDIYDKLPLTGNAFTWSTANISNITYRAGEPGYQEVDGKFTKDAPGKFTYNSVELTNLEVSDKGEWEVVNTCPSEKKKTPADGSQPVEDPPDQRYIEWNESFKIILPPQATVYMYVTLTFTSTDEQWTNFMKEKGTATLVNTFYVHDMPAPVTHTLSDPPVAFLQKGVYETGSYVTQTDAKWLTEQYFSGPDRFHYSNTYKEGRLKNTVTYYVVLRNSGSTNLYLAPIYDILPPGFEYMALRTANGSGNTWYDVGVNNTNNTFSDIATNAGGKDRILAKPGENDFDNNDPYLVSTRVRYSYANDGKTHKTANDCQILKFEFENDADGEFTKLKKDATNGKYYLAPGEYLQFGYTVYTGNNPITEAKNTVVMQYYDPLESDVIPELDEKTPVKVKDIHNTAPNNDGDRYLWENEEASESGFNKTNNIDIIGNYENPKWFASDVTVTREKISPGIKKTVAEPMIPTDKSADWTVTSFNNSATELSDYTITDTLDLPLQFEGKFKYSLWGSDNNGSSSWYVSAGGEPNDDNSYLFEIAREGKDGVKITSNTGTSQSTTIGGDAVELEAKTVCNKNLGEDVRAKFTVQISRDEVNKKEILTIGFSNEKWGIIPNGYSVLKFSTPSKKDENNNAIIDPGTYTNTAMFCPKDKNYDDRITQGKLVRDDDGNNVGVEHSAVVSIYTGSPSGSVKMIEEKEDKTNFTTSEREDNYIRLMNKADVFTYTLEVRNLGETPMSNLVIIDNLPQIGDQTTLRQESKRESEFQVDLAKEGDKIEPAVEVWLYDSTNAEKLTQMQNRDKTSPAKYDANIEHEVLKLNDDYTIEYSEKQKDFNENDWTCVNDTDSKWSETPSDGTRSIRIHLKNDITQNQAIQIRFDAQIHTDTNAQPGRIAWNTFGYSYKVDKLTAKASPNKVGICIPGSPTLTKKVVDSEGNPSKVLKDSKFEFIIYKSDKAIEFENYKAETVAKTLEKSNIEFMYQALDVKKDTSESGESKLENFFKFDYTDDEKFEPFDKELAKNDETFWKTDQTYYVVELDTDKDYRYKSTNKADENNYSFKIDPIRNTPLEFVNENMSSPVELPETGGKGTRMFVFGGLMMICLSAFFLVRNKRKHTQR